jgi:DNA transformation protein
MTKKSVKPDRSSPTKPGVQADSNAEISLASLPNLGPQSAQFLAAAGIHTCRQLASLGSVAAFVAVKRVEPKVSLNLLWALEGALSGLHWREVAREHRTSLLLALETHKDQEKTRQSTH